MSSKKKTHRIDDPSPSESNRDHPLSADCANESLKHVHESNVIYRFPSPLGLWSIVA